MSRMYATAYISISQLAAAMGDQQTQHAFMQRAQNWQSLFNPSSGFIQPRLSNGRFLAGFEPGTSAPAVEDGQAGFVEGNTWQYTWMVPFNQRGLFDAIGGNAEVVRRLDTLFAELTAGMRRARLNGQDWASPWILLSALQSDTPTLDVSLGPMPNPTWGADPRNAPPSFS